MHPAHSSQFMEGMYSCPLTIVGYFILTFGHKFNRIASLTSVKEPLMSA